jgi:hypothetical protein
LDVTFLFAPFDEALKAGDAAAKALLDYLRSKRSRTCMGSSEGIPRSVSDYEVQWFGARSPNAHGRPGKADMTSPHTL